MNKALRSPKLYVIAAILTFLGIAIPFGIYGITLIPALNADLFPYQYLLPVFPFLYLLIGFAVSDVQIARWRHKNSEYDTKLPQDVKDKAWSIRFPFYLAAAVLLSIFLFFEIWFWISGNYPFPTRI